MTTASSSASTTGAGGGGVGSGGSGGGAGSVMSDVKLSLVGPPSGMAFQRRYVDVDVAFSGSKGGGMMRIERGGEIVDERSIDAAATTGTARLRLPLLRGATPFVVTLESSSGGATSVTGELYGASLVTASIDTMFAVRDGAIATWGGGAPTPAKKDAPGEIVSVAFGGDTLFGLDAEGHVLAVDAGKPSFESVAGLDDITANRGRRRARAVSTRGRTERSSVPVLVPWP